MMASSSLAIHLLLIVFLPLAASVAPIGSYCDTSYSSLQTAASITNVLSDLVAKASKSGFATTSSGVGTDKIYGLAQCRGDIDASDCSACIKEAAQQLPIACPGQADARIFYDYCQMRYDNVDFVGLPDTGYQLILINTQNATDPMAFYKVETALMNKVVTDTVVPGKRFVGRQQVQFKDGITIYGLGWCTLDLQPQDCQLCLQQGVTQLPGYCKYRQGCRVVYSSCTVRYEIYPFYFPVMSKASAASVDAEDQQYIKEVKYPN